MLTLPSAVRIFLAAEPVDMRKSIDGLLSVVEARGHDAYAGHLFVFVSRRGDRVKILVWDRGGFVLYYKRLERGRFQRPAVAADASEVRLDATALAMLLDGIDVERVHRPRAWTPSTKLDPIARP